uniref:Uncharacterized protein n=1 Tax=Avena sativa TaxID=4498 RepID=A0ACD5XDR1_AVESA
MAETTAFIQLVRCYTFLATILAKLKLRRRAGVLNLAPGPWTLPVIGNTHNLLGALPHQAMHRLAQRHGPVMLLRLGHAHAVVLSSAEAAREATMEVHGAAFADRPEYATAGSFIELLSSTRLRSFRPVREEEVARTVFGISSSMSYMGPVLVNVSEIVKDMMKDVFTRVCVGETVKPITNVVFSRVSLGDWCPQWEAYLEELDKATGLMSAGLSLTDLFPTSRLARTLGGRSQMRARQEAHRRIQSTVDAMIREHKTAMEKTEEEADDDGGSDVPSDESTYEPLTPWTWRGPSAASADVPREDILTTLLRLQSNGGGVALTNESVSSILFNIFYPGSEAAFTTILWAMSELIRSPSIMTMAQSEVRRVLHRKKVTEANINGQLPYLQMVIRETLRLHPPVPLLYPMSCTEERSKIMGYDVLPGTTVFVNVWAIGRDEESWNDATEFIPERFFHSEKVDHTNNGGSDFTFFPYGGAAQRMCPAMMFAVSNIEIALASLLYHFDWNLPDDGNSEELDMAEAYDGITTHRKTQLLLNARSTRSCWFNSL